jgi:perosamine synthetase
MAAFEAENIDARVFFHPLSSLPIFQPVAANVNSQDIPKRAINLPSYHDMTFEEQARVIATLNQAAHAYG